MMRTRRGGGVDRRLPPKCRIATTARRRFRRDRASGNGDRQNRCKTARWTRLVAACRRFATTGPRTPSVAATAAVGAIDRFPYENVPQQLQRVRASSAWHADCLVETEGISMAVDNGNTMPPLAPDLSQYWRIDRSAGAVTADTTPRDDDTVAPALARELEALVERVNAARSVY
jgi:hypothetical protein